MVGDEPSPTGPFVSRHLQGIQEDSPSAQGHILRSQVAYILEATTEPPSWTQNVVNCPCINDHGAFER